MNETLKRAITGGIFVAAMVASLYIESGRVFTSLMFLAAFLGYREYLTMLESSGKARLSFPAGLMTTLVISALASYSFERGRPYFLLLIIPALALQVLAELRSKEASPFTRIAFAVFGQLWITLPFAMLPLIGRIEGEFQAFGVLGFFLLLWTNDTGAYLAGKAFGKHKLAPHISPGKTIEGFLGGVVLTLLLAYFLERIGGVFPQRDWLVIAGVIAVFSNAGDLVESTLKRMCEVKDSGKLLPGHGGILDRFDGVLLAVPIILAYLLLVNA